MAIIYTINGEEFEIGSGFGTQGAAETPTPIINPFPKYQIQREILKTEDESYLGNKYTITINGQLIIPADADMTVSGERQNALHKQLIWHLQTLSGDPKYHNIGKLEIVPYGGGNKPFIFTDARLISIDIPEQSDESSGVLFSDYTFNFEAYKEVSDNKSNLFLGISSIEESWELSVEDGVSLYPNVTGAPYKTYSITHTVSATGLKDTSTGVSGSQITLAWKKAADRVKTRLVSSPSSIVASDVAGVADSIVKTFNPRLFGYNDDAGILSPNLTSNGYAFYNHIRTPKCDYAQGSYSVTETWTASNMPATLDMEIESSIDDAGLTTMTLSGTITGLDLSPVNSNAIDKLNNAQSVLTTIDSNAYAIVSSFYTPTVTIGATGADAITGASLKNVIRSKTIGTNKITGVITFNYTYNDSAQFIPNSVSSSLTINDENEYGDVQVIAIIPIIAKSNGPIIQNMGTTSEKKRNLTLEAVMKPAFRTTKPNVASFVNNYRPTNSYITSNVESWQPGNGSYSLNIEWTYI